MRRTGQRRRAAVDGVTCIDGENNASFYDMSGGAMIRKARRRVARRERIVVGERVIILADLNMKLRRQAR